MNTGIAAEAPQDASLKGASINRLTCLVRQWTWADEAMTRFDRELRVHGAFGDALREEQMSRELDFLDTQDL